MAHLSYFGPEGLDSTLTSSHIRCMGPHKHCFIFLNFILFAVAALMFTFKHKELEEMITSF